MRFAIRLTLRGLLLLFGLVWVCSLCGCSRFDPAFDRPTLLTKTPDGSKIIIFDSRNKRFLITDPSLKLISTISHPNFDSVWGCCITPKNELVVTNTRYLKASFDEEEKKANAVAEILFFDLHGTLLHQMTWLEEKGALIFPAQIYTPDGGIFYVTDYRLNQVIVINRKQEVIKTIGTYGDGPGQFYYPNDILETADGNLLVSDSYNNRLQLFDQRGAFLKVVIDKGHEEGKIMFPQFMAKDGDGNIYVTDYYSMRVTVLDRNLQFKKALYPKVPTSPENPHGNMELIGVCVMPDNKSLLVADSLNSQIFHLDFEGQQLNLISTCPEGRSS